VYTMSITAQQLVADRHTAYEGVAARRRLRKLGRRAAPEAPSETLAAPATARIVGPGAVSALPAAPRKVA
jgi:hypothetical protein